MVDHNRVYQEKFEASERAAANMLKRIGVALEKLDRWVTEAPDDEHYIMGVAIKVRYDTVGDVLVVVKADSANGKKVGFHTADTVSEAIVGMVHRLDNGQFIWKEDVPYDQRSN